MEPGHLTTADGVGERLRAELAGVISALPPDARAVSAMTRHLGIDRSICQRVVSAATFKGPGRAVLGRVPGVAGLMSFVRAARRKGVDAGWVSGAEVAAARFADLLRELNLSQAGLVRGMAMAEGGPRAEVSLTGPLHSSGPATATSRRQRLMVDAADLTGTATDLNIVMAAYRPSPADPRRLEGGYVRGFIGYRARADGMPLVVAWGSATVDAARELRAIDGSAALGHAPQALLADYCSRPLPTITGRDNAGGRVFVIDPGAAGAAGGAGASVGGTTATADVVIASRSPNSMPHPMVDDPPMIEVWGQTQVPGRNVLLDVWLHESLARQGVPSVGEYLATPAIASGKGRDWTRRLPGSPRLQLLGRGVAQSHSVLYERHAALCADFFRALGWDESEMVGFRCEHTAPVFGSALCVAFEFPRGAEQTPGDATRSAD